MNLGRRDSTTANRTQANTDLPAFFEDLDAILEKFSRKNLNARDMVALSGNNYFIIYFDSTYMYYYLLNTKFNMKNN